MNTRYQTHGGMFSTPFKRIEVNDEAYFTQLIYYLHYNPVHHKIAETPAAYNFSSYNSFLSDKPTLLPRDKVFEWFGGREAFIKSFAASGKLYR